MSNIKNGGGLTSTPSFSGVKSLFVDDGVGDFASLSVEDTGGGVSQADAVISAESDSNPNQPNRAEVSTHTGDGTLFSSFIRLQAEDGPARFFNLEIQPSNTSDGTTPTLKLNLPTNDVDIAGAAGAIVAYLKITANAGAGLPLAIYKIPLYAA